MMAKKKPTKVSSKIKKILSEKQEVKWVLRPEILCCQKIPKALHGVVPREILGKKWWDETRDAAYRSTDFHCVACGVHKYEAKSRQWLEGHEVYEIDYLSGIAEYKETVPLCHYCHNYIHDGRLKALLEAGRVHHAKYVAVIQHGDDVLKKHSLVRDRYDGPIADWSDWRLIINGKTYKPKYASESDHFLAMEKVDVEEEY